MSSIIKVSNLGKKYIIAHNQPRRRGYRRFSEDVAAAFTWPARVLRAQRNSDTNGKSKHEEFWALRDIDFEVKEGEVVGIIGRNGAGKSTLLKLLSRITEPTTGRIELFGRIASLLEVGTGFHPELTGRENIFLNGAILGMTRAEIYKKFDEIVAFAEVEKFLDTPVKRYSSGMHVRLAFAVAAHLDPEILLVDEVLAVGDAEFQKKCLGKMQDVSHRGRTVLFVSHNMATVASLCSRAVLLRQGKIQTVGDTSTVVAEYLASVQNNDSNFNLDGRRNVQSRAKIVEAWLEKDGIRVSSLLFGDRATIVLRIAVSDRLRFAVELLLRDQDGMPVAFAPSGLAQGWEVDGIPGIATICCKLPPVRHAAGQYTVDLTTAISGIEFLDYVESGLSFNVSGTAIGPRNWSFHQSRGHGCGLWDVHYSAETTSDSQNRSLSEPSLTQLIST